MKTSLLLLLGTFSTMPVVAENPAKTGTQVHLHFREFTVAKAESQKAGIQWLFENRRSVFPVNITQINTYPISAVLTNPQAQMVYKVLEKHGVISNRRSSLTIGEGQTAFAQSGPRQWRVTPEVAPDGNTIHLEIFLSKSPVGFGKAKTKVTSPGKITLSDGQIVSVNVGKRFGKSTTMFIGVQLLPPETN